MILNLCLARTLTAVHDLLRDKWEPELAAAARADAPYR